jgi:hypothetical protein
MAFGFWVSQFSRQLVKRLPAVWRANDPLLVSVGRWYAVFEDIGTP